MVEPLATASEEVADPPAAVETDDEQPKTGDETPEEPEGGETPPEETPPDEPEQPAPIPYVRFKEVNDERKKWRDVATAAGYEIDELTGDPVQVRQPEQKEADPVPTVVVTAPAQAPVPPNQWSKERVDEFAAEYGFDLDEMDANAKANFNVAAWNSYEKELGQHQQAQNWQQAATTRETQATDHLKGEIEAAKSDPHLSLAPEAVQYVTKNVAELRAYMGQPQNRQWLAKNGFAGVNDYVATMLPRIKADAIANNIGAITLAAAKGANGADGLRKKALGANSPKPVASERVVEVDATVRHYAESSGIAADRLAAEMERIAERNKEQ